MKEPRTLLNAVEEVGCRLMRLEGTRAGYLLIGTSKHMRSLASDIRRVEWPTGDLAGAMNELAGRLERIAALREVQL